MLHVGLNVTLALRCKDTVGNIDKCTDYARRDTVGVGKNSGTIADIPYLAVTTHDSVFLGPVFAALLDRPGKTVTDPCCIVVVDELQVGRAVRHGLVALYTKEFLRTRAPEQLAIIQVELPEHVAGGVGDYAQSLFGILECLLGRSYLLEQFARVSLATCCRACAPPQEARQQRYTQCPTVRPVVGVYDQVVRG